MKRRSDTLWRGLILLILLLAAATLWPHSASKPNALGYYSVCPFAPWATLIMIAMAGAIQWVRRRRRAAH